MKLVAALGTLWNCWHPQNHVTFHMWQPAKEMELVEVLATRALKDRVGQQEKKPKFYGVQSPENSVVQNREDVALQKCCFFFFFFSSPWETDYQPINSWSPMGTLFSDKPKWVQLGITLQATARWKAFQHHAADIFRLFQCHTKVAKPEKRICTSWEECKQYVHGVKGVPWRRIW